MLRKFERQLKYLLSIQSLWLLWIKSLSVTYWSLGLQQSRSYLIGGNAFGLDAQVISHDRTHSVST